MSRKYFKPELPYNSPAFQTQLKLREQREIHKNMNDDDVDEITNITGGLGLIIKQQIHKELMGEWRFETTSKSLINQQNKFWYYLIQNQRIAVLKLGEDYIFLNPIDIKLDIYGNPKGNIILQTRPSMDGTQSTVKQFVRQAKNVVIINWDILFYGFLISFKWVWEIVEYLVKLSISAYTMRNKKMVIYQRTDNDSIAKRLQKSLKSSDPYIFVEDPKAVAGEIHERNGAVGKIAVLDELSGYGDNSGIQISDIIDFINFAKDMMGMNSYTAHKKERLITSEVDSQFYNTIAMRQNHLTELSIAEERLKNIGLNIRFFNVIDEMEKKQMKEQEEKDKKEKGR